MKKIINLMLMVSLVVSFWWPQIVWAADDWYIKDFSSQVVVNKDSTATITEDIVADCGNAEGKHGIFRILPLTSQKTTEEIIKSPIELISITDFVGRSYKYEEILNRQDKTITWKIGDANKTVHGVNNYRIKYLAKNVIRAGNTAFDEFYWNLNGNFWQLATDNFKATISFPPEVTANNAEINLYSGSFGVKDEGLVDYKWEGNNLIVQSKRQLQAGEGITISVTTPKNIFTLYILTEKDEHLYDESSLTKSAKKALTGVAIIWPFVVFGFCFWLWKTYGQDPKINRAVAPEFEIPDNLTPLAIGMVDTNGRLNNQFISATIINLAVKGYLVIEMIGKTNIFSGEDYKFKTTGKNLDGLDKSERLVYEKVFGGENEIKLSELRNKFYKELSKITLSVNEKLKADDILKLKGNTIKGVMIFGAMVLLFASFWCFSLVTLLGLAGILGAVIMFVFAFLMPSRTQKGAELEMRIKGFRMYMETAEKYRQQFNEKENIMEKFLPYAILFGLTKKWIESMKNIYGEEYFNSYSPVWLHGALLTNGHFDMNHLTGTIESMSRDMAVTMASSPSSSGSGGGGFSGGGGGGGGGGGW